MMDMKRPFSAAVFAMAFITAGFLQAAQAEDAHTGTATTELQYVHAVQENGSPDTGHDADCEKQLSDENSRFVGMSVRTTYEINTSTNMMSAESTFPAPQSMEPLELTVELSSLGISDVYAFGTFKPSMVPEAYAILFSIDHEFEDATSTFVIYGPEGEGYNCVISSSEDADSSAVAGKFKEE
ncbi:hypothetical protein [Thioflavicoccus mobilis]|nr:hypothetical protein [Thioflavicoccus mobilis]